MNKMPSSSWLSFTFERRTIFPASVISSAVRSTTPVTEVTTMQRIRVFVSATISWSLKLGFRFGQANRLRILMTGIMFPFTSITPSTISGAFGKELPPPCAQPAGPSSMGGVVLCIKCENNQLIRHDILRALDTTQRVSVCGAKAMGDGIAVCPAFIKTNKQTYTPLNVKLCLVSCVNT